MSDNEHITVRIVDIARMAGVSVATVDRVIHNRGKVSEENLARINEVLRRVDYRPNLIARSLASGRRYTLCAVMPRFAPGEYWADFEAGIARAEAEAKKKAEQERLAREKEEAAREALRLASHKLPGKCKIGAKRTAETENGGE